MKNKFDQKENILLREHFSDQAECQKSKVWKNSKDKDDSKQGKWSFKFLVHDIGKPITQLIQLDKHDTIEKN